MIAIDTSAWIAFFEGAPGEDVELVGRALRDSQACLAPVVLMELLSDPKLPRQVAALLEDLPLGHSHDQSLASSSGLSSNRGTSS